MIDLEKCKNEFLKYTEKFNLNIIQIKRKQTHSIRVMEKSKIIAESLNLSKEEIEIATLIGLLHDIGRFEQYTKYKTFSDHKSVDHAHLGVKILKENNYIKKYIDDEKWIDIILTAIENHNKYTIQDGLDEKTLMFCKIIRDADKADIIYEASEIFWDTPEEIEKINKTQVKDIVYNTAMKNKLVDKRTIGEKTELDGMITITCLVFDMNYSKSFEMISKDKLIDKIFNRFNLEDEQSKIRLDEIHKCVNKYIKENKG